MLASKQQVNVADNLQNIGQTTEENIELNDFNIILPSERVDRDISGLDILDDIFIDFLYIFFGKFIKNTLPACEHFLLFGFLLQRVVELFKSSSHVNSIEVETDESKYHDYEIKHP